MPYKYVSADNHLDLRWVPRNLWQERVARRFRDAAPKVVETDQGSLWGWEGKLVGGRDGGSADGPDNAKLVAQFFGKARVTVPPGALPPADPALLLQHMDLAGIYACVCYGATRKWEIDDPELCKEVYRVYNDWVMELNAAAPERLLILPHLATQFPDWCEKEVWRLARLGAKAVEFCAFDVAKPISDEVWEPVWAAAQETGIPLCAHIGGRAGAPYPDPARGAQLAYFALAPFGIARPLTELVYCGALEKFPGLRFSFAECRAGWIPFLVYWMDRQMRERPQLAARSALKLKPSEYVRRQVTVTFEEDDIAGMLFQHADAFLGDIAIWGADYPHEQGTWPDADAVIERIFAGVDPAVRRRVLFEHACEFFRIDGPPGGFAD